MDAVLAPYLLKKKYDLIVLTVDPGYHNLASKLYTNEYFSNIKKLLKKDGVFIFWLDYTLEKNNEDLIVNTAKNNFNNQKFYSIYDNQDGKSTYYLVVNSDSKIRYRIPIDVYFKLRNNQEFVRYDLLKDDKRLFEYKLEGNEINTWNKNKINKFKRMNP